MKISTKTKYGIISLIYLGEIYHGNSHTSLVTISKHYNISKLYLEQAFVLLKKSGLVISTKGSKGGYILAKEPSDISLYEIISVLEPAIFEKNNDELKDFPEIETALNKLILDNINEIIIQKMEEYTLLDLINERDTYKNENYFMNYI